MAKSYGVIQPPEHGTRWLWPVKDMEPGDEFEVDQVDKPHGHTANVIRVLAHQYGKRVSIVHHPDKPGFTLVTCMSWDEVPVREKQVPVMHWKQFQMLMHQHGATAEDQLIGQAQHCWPVDWTTRPRMNKLVLDVHGGPYAVLLASDHVVSTRVGEVVELEAPEPIEDDAIASLMPAVVDRDQLLAD